MDFARLARARVLPRRKVSVSGLPMYDDIVLGRGWARDYGQYAYAGTVLKDGWKNGIRQGKKEKKA